MEHRWGQRVAVDVPIRLSAGPFSGGCAPHQCQRQRRLRQIEFRPRLLSHIELAIELPQRFMHAMPRLMAYVTRKFKSGAGIEWCEFAPPAVSELIRSATPRRYGYSRRSVTPARAQPQPRAPAHSPEPPHGPESPRGAEETRAAIALIAAAAGLIEARNLMRAACGSLLGWWARSDSNRGPRDSLFPAVSSGSGLSLHPLVYEEKGVRDARACH